LLSNRQTITERYPYQPPTGRKCRVFISHAGEQKRELVDFICEKLRQDYPALAVKEGGGVFLDELSLQGGDGAIDEICTSLLDALVGTCATLPPAV
jgi:hypothetical protein